MRNNKTNMPSHFNVDERATLLALLDHGRQSLMPYDGAWKADWLLSDVTAPIWPLRTSESRFVNGAWRRVRVLHWRATLPDGSLLTDPENSYILGIAQRATFLVRFLSGFGIDSSLALEQWAARMKTLCQWLFLNEALFAPRTHAFSRVNTGAINDFFSSYISGGKSRLLQLPERCLRYFYEKALGREVQLSTDQRLFQIPPADTEAITAWLESENFYTRKNSSRDWNQRYIDRGLLADCLSCGWQEMKSDRMNSFLRQFEPELVQASSQLLLPINGFNTEYPGHWIRDIDTVFRTPVSFTHASAMLSTWKDLFRLKRHLPDALPPTEHIDLSAPKYMVAHKSSPVKHTPWVPLKTALQYTTEALRLLVTVGDVIVDFYIEALRAFSGLGLFNEQRDSSSVRRVKRDSRNDWIRRSVPDQLSELRISGWTTVFAAHSRNVHHLLRTAPALSDILQVLVGGVVVLIGITKPSRGSELRSLRRDCVRLVEGDGYWIEHKNRKANANDHLLNTSKPIPAVTARAISLLGRLGDALCELFSDNDSYAQESLFYLPTFRVTGTPNPRVLDSMAFIDCLDAFCDYVALPSDSHGRRWYVRPHELRKSFLITFFWCFKYSSLDAARWVAGHSSAEHVYAYIEANFPGEELPQIEAEYAAKQLRDWSSEEQSGEEENLDLLYSAVCDHFQVSNISLIGESELEDWLVIAFSKGIYRIEPYEMHSRDNLVKTVIAFRVNEVVEDGS
ncbi:MULTISPECIES: hypothetical protein [Marinobacter]|jgi:integrase|uniref:hypothetical protein n=1 Tax=Marinobacter TaxID=2742 RepID=UPI00273D6505|nr:hypothetical protein [Marinobacter salsuginis]MCR9188466.1 hypothetical protein [Alteromonadaceae bacterium]